MNGNVPSNIEFQDQPGAARCFEQIALRLPAKAVAALRTLLAESPDPDAALKLFYRLVEASTDEFLRRLDSNRKLIHYALLVFGFSQFLGETLIQNPDVLESFVDDSTLARSKSLEDYKADLLHFESRTGDSALAQTLARFKRREYIRIMIRDVLHLATLAETTLEISALSDALLQEALLASEKAMVTRYGVQEPDNIRGKMSRGFSVLSLGKLGGSELNYSSDIDLLFLFDPSEAPGASEISSREYFIRLAQHLTESLSRTTLEGPVFRIDLRLRPEGKEGEPAVALSHSLHYYEEVAQDWELQAMIKLRCSAGNSELARRFIQGIQPRVYSSKLNFSAIDTALKSQERVVKRRKIGWRPIRSTGSPRAPITIDVKNDRGGIRDIEFLVQCLQRVYGGTEPWLRSGGTLFSLQKLHDKGHLLSKDFHDLNLAYTSLRTIEHRLQLRRGRQVHSLPTSEGELRILCRQVSDVQAHNCHPAEVVETLKRQMEAVSAIYSRIIHHEQQQASNVRATGEFALQQEILQSGEPTYRQMLDRIASDLPELYSLALRADLKGQGHRNLKRFLASAFTTSENYATILQNSEALNRVSEVLRLSDYLSDILVRDPEEIASIVGIEPALEASPGLFPAAPRKPNPCDPVLDYLTTSSTSQSEKLAYMRRSYIHRQFISAVRDVLQGRPVFHSLQETSVMAQQAIEAALKIAHAPESFAVMALGRLGLCEFDIASDADLLFVREAGLDSVAATRTAEQIVQILSAYTQDGMMFSVDPRLRPRGAEGELVNTVEEFESYFAREAQPWEALTYTKLRLVAGDAALGERVSGVVMEQSKRFKSSDTFAKDVREMRMRLDRVERGGPNLKTGVGAFYDIDFMVSYLLLRHSPATDSHKQTNDSAACSPFGNTPQRLTTLATLGALTPNEYATLIDETEFLRTLDHCLRLVTGRPQKTLPKSVHARNAVAELTSLILKKHLSGGMEVELSSTFATVRNLFDSLVN